VSTQKRWYLGGPNSVRGFAPGALAGNAFWFSRFEIGSGHPVARPAIFADIGWAGDRSVWSTPGKPISGVGVGMTFIDGIIRLDVARASTTGKFRADFYLNPR
jgi:hemolysin activation/secretion protein